MANITTELNTIENRSKGEHIRFPIHDAIQKINQQIEDQNAGIEQEDDEGGDTDA